MPPRLRGEIPRFACADVIHQGLIIAFCNNANFVDAAVNEI